MSRADVTRDELRRETADAPGGEQRPRLRGRRAPRKPARNTVARDTARLVSRVVVIVLAACAVLCGAPTLYFAVERTLQHPIGGWLAVAVIVVAAIGVLRARGARAALGRIGNVRSVASAIALLGAVLVGASAIPLTVHRLLVAFGDVDRTTLAALVRDFIVPARGLFALGSVTALLGTVFEMARSPVDSDA